MTTNDFRFEGYFAVKDGRKWKNRYCVFKQPNKLLDHFKLYLFKDRDDYQGRINLSDVTPFDDVLGYESGHVIDTHYDCILMVGRRSVFFIGYRDVNQMMIWVQKLKEVLKCHFFRLTLESVENNRSLPRQPGSLHIQRSRICFVREPENSMSKLVCAWDVKEVKQCGIDPETRFFFIEAGRSKSGKMRGKYFFSCASSGSVSVENVRTSVAETLNDRVPYLTHSVSSGGRSPPTPAQFINHSNDPVVGNSLPRRRASANCHSSLPPPPLPPPPPPPPEHDEQLFDDNLPPPPPPPPCSSSPQAAIVNVNTNILETLNFPRRVAGHSGSHECLQSRHEESLFPNATLQRPAKQSSPGYSDCLRNPSLRQLTACDDDRRPAPRGDIFRRSNSLNIQSTKQDKSSTNILQRIFKKRSRSETDFSGGSSSAGSTSGALSKETYRAPSVEPDGDDEVFDENPFCSSVPSSSPEGLPNSLGADVTLSPIREDRTPCGPAPSINSSRTRSVSATYTGSQGYRLSSTGSSGTGENSTLKRNDTVNSGEENRSNCQPWNSNKMSKEPDYIPYPNNPFHYQGSFVSNTSQTPNLGYVTLPHPRKGVGLQRSHSTVSGASHSPAAANTTNVMAAKPRFGNEYVHRGTLRSVSQCTADSSSGSSLSTTPAMACPLPSDPMSGGHRHYVNFPGIIPTGCESVAARTGYVNLDMRTSDDYVQVDLRRPGHSAPECPPHLHYAKLHFHRESRPADHSHTHHRLSNSADPCDYIELDTSRTKALSNMVTTMSKSDEATETQTIPETGSLRRVSQDVHNSSSPPSGLNTSNNGGISSRNPSFRKIRNPFSNRKNSEATS